MQLSEKEFVEFLQQKEREVEEREKDLKRKTKQLIYVAVLIPLILFGLGHHWIMCLASPTYLEPEEGDTKVLNLHERHWFSDDSVQRVEVRRSDFGAYEWMKKTKNGEWVQAFEWNQQDINQ